MKGYKTITFNVLAALSALTMLAGAGPIPEDDRAAVVLGIAAVVNIGLRLITATKVFNRV